MRKLLLFFLLLPLAGCLEVEQRFTINPDGSGKVTVESFVTDWSLDAHDRDIKKKLRESAREMIDSTRGVEVWRDVRYSLEKGRFHFKGTAYFRDLSQLEGKSLGLARLQMSSLADGTRRITLAVESKASFSSTSSSTNSEATGSALSIDEQIDSMRTVVEMMKGMMGSFLDGLRIRTELSIPGPPAEAPGFTRNRMGNLEFELTGETILAVMDTLMNDRELMRAQLNRPPDSSSAVMRQLLFPNGIPTATIPVGAAPLFDYAKEVAAARRGHEKLLRDLRK